MVSQKTAWLILLVIIVSAAGLRFAGLTRYPPSLNWDEVSHAYNAFSLLHSGTDQWGQLPVLNFRAYGDYPTTLNLYATVPAIALFGPTDFAVRFPHTLIGVLTVLVAYVAATRWQNNRLTGLFAAAMVSFEPWTFFPSRAVFQSNWVVLLLFLALALYFSRKTLSAILFLGLSLLAYHNTRIFVPGLLLFLVFHKPIVANKTHVFAAITVLVFSLGILAFSGARARGSWVGIVDTGAVAFLESARNTSRLPQTLARALYNRPVYFAVKFADNYFGYFSPRFFLAGGTQYQFSLPGFGVFNPVLLPFIYLGLYCLIKQKSWPLIVWILLAPIPAALTRDHYAVIRATTLLPALILSTSLGLTFMFRHIPKLIRLTGLVVYLLILGVYMFEYFAHYPRTFSRDWQYGYFQLVEYLETQYDKYDYVLLTKRYAEPHEYVFWYWPVSPQRLRQSSDFEYDFHDNWYWVNKFEKIEFVNDWDMVSRSRGIPPGQKTLIIASPENIPPEAKIHQINFLDSTPAFIILEKT